MIPEYRYTDIFQKNRTKLLHFSQTCKYFAQKVRYFCKICRFREVARGFMRFLRRNHFRRDSLSALSSDFLAPQNVHDDILRRICSFSGYRDPVIPEYRSPLLVLPRFRMVLVVIPRYRYPVIPKILSSLVLSRHYGSISVQCPIIKISTSFQVAVYFPISSRPYADLRHLLV